MGTPSPSAGRGAPVARRHNSPSTDAIRATSGPPRPPTIRVFDVIVNPSPVPDSTTDGTGTSVWNGAAAAAGAGDSAGGAGGIAWGAFGLGARAHDAPHEATTSVIDTAARSRRQPP